MKIRIATVYPATAALPKELTMRTKTIQLVCPMAYWNMPFSATRTIRFITSQFRVQWDVMKRIVRVALNGMFQYAIGQTSWMVLVRIVSSFGSAAVAGYTVAIRIFIFVILPSWGLASAAATLVGQNLGAGKPDRAERSVWLTTFYNMLFLGGVGVLLIVFPEPIIRVFTDDPAV